MGVAVVLGWLAFTAVFLMLAGSLVREWLHVDPWRLGVALAVLVVLFPVIRPILFAGG